VNDKNTNKPRLSQNIIWNLIGSLAPLLIALLAVPVIIEALGVARFGVLTLIWAAIGYFNLFDFGLGQALTKLVAERKSKLSSKALSSLIWTGLSMMLGLSLISIIVVWFLSSPLVHHWLKIPIDLQEEALDSFKLLALGLPVVITTAGLRGILEAYQEFRKINMVRIPLGVFIFISPLLVLPFSTSLIAIVSVLLIGRFLAWCVYLRFCMQVLPDLRNQLHIDSAEIKPLFSFGGWMTVSGIIGPVMTYFDRFIIGALISMAAVAYYVTPYEVITKLWIIPAATVGVLFPAFAAAFSKERARATILYSRGQKFILLLIVPVVIFTISFAEHGLMLWLGDEFAQKSTFVLQCLALGVLVNCMAYLPSSLIRGAGRPDLTAKLHLLELPVYIIFLWVMIKNYGINGAALGWLLRNGLDMLLLFFFSSQILPEVRSNIYRHLIALSVALSLGLFSMTIESIVMKTVLVILVTILAVSFLWKDVKTHGTFSRREN
jgi:O-antigen/teichoic acid export membrane protein